MNIIFFVALLLSTTFISAGGFGENTTLKIIPKFLKEFNMYSHEIRKSSAFGQLYYQQKKIKKGEYLKVQTYTLPYRDFGPQPFFGPIPEQVKIVKTKTNTAIGINLSDRKRKTILDFDIICDPKQVFAMTGYLLHAEARRLSKGCPLLCLKENVEQTRRIHEIVTIECDDMDLYRVVAQQYCMVLLSRYGAMGLVSPDFSIEEEK